MPPPSAALRRKRLADFIDSNGKEMVRPCGACVANKRVCRVHVRSGRCAECVRRGVKCNIRVTESEWDRLKKERDSLLARIEAAREESNKALAKEMRLRR